MRNFQLVMCAHVRDDEREYSVRKLKQIVAEAKAKVGYDNNFPEPLVTHAPWEPL
jgi:hypothetical protein